jgi:excisionase family DNA binding protein
VRALREAREVDDVTDRLLTAEELAARWQVEKGHVYRLTRTGQVPTVRIGRYYRYRLEAIESFERKNEKAA